MHSDRQQLNANFSSCLIIIEHFLHNNKQLHRAETSSLPFMKTKGSLLLCSLDPSLNQMVPLYILIPYFFNNNFNIIILSKPRSVKSLFPSDSHLLPPILFLVFAEIRHKIKFVREIEYVL